MRGLISCLAGIEPLSGFGGFLLFLLFLKVLDQALGWASCLYACTAPWVRGWLGLGFWLRALGGLGFRIVG